MATRTREKTESHVRTRTDCRMCNGAELSKIWSFGNTPLANSYLKPEEIAQNTELEAPLDVYYCADCHLVQLLDVVSQHELFDNYLYVSSTSPTFVDHFKQYAERITERFNLGNTSFVIDVGSNDGVLLKPLQEAGIRVLGIDPAGNIADQATSDGLPTIAEYFTPAVAKDIAKQHGLANIITANNVFAHTDYVDSFTAAVKEVLAADGVFIIEAQYLGDLLTNNLFDIVYHEHVCYYSVHPLVTFFSKHDMEVFDVEQLPVHGGSIRVYVQHADGPHDRHQRLDNILQQEIQQGLTSLTPYQDFAHRIDRNKVTLQTMLRQLKSQGKRIVGYGAPAKATTLMHVLGLDQSTLDFIIDDAPLKQGLVMPGTHVPIVSSDHLYNENIDYCLILAWNFAEPIMANHAKFAQRGGHFIIPVPEAKLV